jgi:hypothetical protein
MLCEAALSIDIRLIGTENDEDLRALAGYLLRDQDMRGRVRLRERPPQVGSLGAVLEALSVIAEPGGAALVAAIVAWARMRRSDLTIDLTRADGVKVKVDAARIRTLDPQGVGQFIDDTVSRLTSMTSAPSAPPPVPSDTPVDTAPPSA